MPRPRAGAQGGFTLIEAATVLVIVGLALATALRPLAAQLDLRNVEQTRRAMEAAQDALLGYAAATGHLPCPDRLDDGDGLEDRRVEGVDGPLDGCAAGVYDGWLPAATLGVPAVDAWGGPLRYRVARELTRGRGDPSAIGPCEDPEGDNRCTADLGDPGDLRVHTRDLATRAVQPLAIAVPAVLWSAGANGAGVVNGAALGADEEENRDGDSAFTSRERTPAQEGCDDTRTEAPPCSFDDLVAWLSPWVLSSRLIAAGRWP